MMCIEEEKKEYVKIYRWYSMHEFKCVDSIIHSSACIFQRCTIQVVIYESEKRINSHFLEMLLLIFTDKVNFKKEHQIS